MFIAPLAGVVIDRVDRKRLLEGSIAFQGVIVGTLALLLVGHLLSFMWIVVLVFLLNAAAQFPRATVPALLPRLVSTDDLMTANSLYSFSTSSNQLVSLSLGGLVIAVFGVTFPIYYDAATFFVAALLVTFVSAAYTARNRAPGAGASPSPPGLAAQLAEAWRFVRADRVLSELLVLGLTLNVFGGILIALLAPYTALTLGGSAAVYGFLLAGLAAGSIAGAVVLGAVPVRRFVGRLIFVGIGGVGACIAGLGLLPAFLPHGAGPFGLSAAAFGALALLAALGLALTAANLPLGALFQIRIPEELRGRSMGMMLAILTAPQPVGALLAASLSRAISLDGLLLVSGLIVLVATGIFLGLLPNLRNAAY